MQERLQVGLTCSAKVTETRGGSLELLCQLGEAVWLVKAILAKRYVSAPEATHSWDAVMVYVERLGRASRTSDVWAVPLNPPNQPE